MLSVGACLVKLLQRQRPSPLPSSAALSSGGEKIKLPYDTLGTSSGDRSREEISSDAAAALVNEGMGAGLPGPKKLKVSKSTLLLVGHQL